MQSYAIISLVAGRNGWHGNRRSEPLTDTDATVFRMNGSPALEKYRPGTRDESDILEGDL